MKYFWWAWKSALGGVFPFRIGQCKEINLADVSSKSKEVLK